jgi:very-short-patch-repair endonuclease
MEVAARQHGVVTTADLAAAGIGARGVARRLADGWLRRLHRGVFLVGPLHGARTKEMAAVLACGSGAALSHCSAAALWGMTRPWLGPLEVTVTEGASRGCAGIRVHRVQSVDPRDTRRREGVPTTSPARTLLDIAALVTSAQLSRALEEAQVQRLVTARQVAALLLRSGGRRGAAALREALQNQHDPSLTRSEAERRLLEQIRAAGLPQPKTNQVVLGYEVDFVWPELKLIVEVDGYAFHSSRAAFERDRRRDARLTAAGYRVVRLTYAQVLDGTILEVLR